MPPSWESSLDRWSKAGLLDDETAARIRIWESGRGGAGGARWPARLALALGGILLAAGVLLFVAAHWDALSPGQRFTLVLLTVAALHIGGALADRVPGLALTLHACGTVALGGGIFLAGQIFHLEEHWPAGVMLWALGAWIGWWLRRDWAQGALAALLTPAWLGSEWAARTTDREGAPILGMFLVGLAVAYLGAEREGHRSTLRRALVWIGAIAIIPAVAYLMFSADHWRVWQRPFATGLIPGWIVAVAVPLAAGWLLRGREAWPVAAGAAWAALAIVAASIEGAVPYIWLGLLAVGMIVWGVRERRPVRVNLGTAGFALTVTLFYFSSVMDKLGRSASLIGLGLLFLGGGYLLERARRRLLAEIRSGG